MPHFIIDCSRSVLDTCNESDLLRKIHRAVLATGLFDEQDIKIRLHPFDTFLVANRGDDFIHVFAHIMQGRSTEQKAGLSRQIVELLVELFPHFSNIAMNVAEFEQATYCNKAMLDRHV
jgi:5-carboxymethyl-2-hydroxymuconate isomerase